MVLWKGRVVDDSLITCDPVGSWRYCVQSFPIRRPPSAATSRSPPAASGNSLCPRLAFPKSSHVKESKEIQNDRQSATRPKEKRHENTLFLLFLRALPVFQFLVLPSAHVRVLAPALLNRFPVLSWILARFRWHFSWPHPAPHFHGAQEIQDQLDAPFVCKEVSDRETVLPSSRRLPHFRPQDLLLRFPAKCSRVCVLYWHHPHSAVSAFFVHFRYCPVRQCPVLSWWNRPASFLDPRPPLCSGASFPAFCTSFRFFLLASSVLPPTSSPQFRASDQGRGIRRLDTISRAGHHRTSMIMSGLAALSCATFPSPRF